MKQERSKPEVERSGDCGNSPKNRFAEDIAVALEIGDTDLLTKALVDDSLWERADGAIQGDEVIQQHIRSHPCKAVVVTIDHVVTHGRVGAINGVVRQKGGISRRFCHVIEFTNTKCEKVRRLVSYADTGSDHSRRQ